MSLFTYVKRPELKKWEEDQIAYRWKWYFILIGGSKKMDIYFEDELDIINSEEETLEFCKRNFGVNY